MTIMLGFVFENLLGQSALVSYGCAAGGLISRFAEFVAVKRRRRWGGVFGISPQPADRIEEVYYKGMRLRETLLLLAARAEHTK